MDIKVVNCVTVTPPPSSGTEPYPVFTLQVRSGHWNWQIVRNFFQIDHFNTEAAKIVKDLAKLPPKAIDENTKASLTEYFSSVCSKEELEPLLQDRLVSSENAFSECEALATPASYSGVLEFSADKKKWETKWCSLREDTLYAFNEKEYDDRKPRFLPKFTIALLNATINPVGANEVEIATAFGNSFYLRAATTADRDAWASSLIQNSAHEEGDRRALSPSQQTKLNDLKGLLGAAYEAEYDDRALTRYLVEHQWNVESVNLLVQNDKVFREEFNVKGLKIASIYESFKGGKCFYTGYRDKAGRPIIVFRAAKHDPNADYMETMKLVIYSCERAIEAMGDDTEQATLVYDLNGFERKHQDNRTIKLLLEMVQAHYPHRIGLLLAVSAPWLFRLVFKVIRPWLSEDLVSKVHIYGDTAQMAKYINPDQLLREYGGTATFDLEAYANSRAGIEGLALATAGTPAGEHQFLNDEIVSRFSDCPADKTIKDAIIHGWLKKQAGWVKRFNKRYCILKGSVLYYYAGKKDARAEGVVPLRNATFVPEGLNFHIITKSGKDCVFSVEKKERDGWFNNLQEVIVRLGGSVKEVSLADASGEENSLDVLNSSGQWKAAANPDIVIALLGRLRGIVQANVADGKLNVEALKASPEFSQFEQATCELQKVELAKLSEPVRTAFFLNLYHLLLVHAQIKIGNATDADTRFNLFNSPCYVVDGLYFTLQDISHGILRANVCHPSRLGFSKHFLEVKKDPRVKYIVKAVDPRIHFAINANHWCNTLEYVVPFEDLENQLNLAASNYLRSVVEIKDDHAVLPILVNWFAADFGKSEAEIKTYLSQFLDDARKDPVKNASGVYYKPYDWSNLGIASLL